MRPDRVFVGRRQELAGLEELRAHLDDHGSAILVEGPPGAGKTALIEKFEQGVATHGLATLRAAGTPAEAIAPYSALHLLLQPLLGRLSELPPPQRGALRTAFGLQEGGPPAPFLAGLATLTLWSERARDRPLLVIGEDLHWFDPASRLAVLVAARRVDPFPVLVVLTARSGAQGVSADGIVPLPLPPLSFLEANLVLDGRPDAPGGATRRALLELAAGNPLALVDLSAADVVAGGPHAVPVTDRLEGAFAGRYGELPEPARLMVLAAALGGGESTAEASAAAARVLGRPAEPGWVIPAVEAGLVRTSPARLAFRHPLVRSAVVSTSPAGERTRVLRALVETIRDAERTVWWRTELAMGADPRLADELDRHATSILATGDSARAAYALRRAADLTVDPRTRDDRVVRAADAARHAGAYDIADDLLRRAEATVHEPGLRARAAWTRELLPDGTSALSRGDFGPALEAVEGLRVSGQRDAALAALLQLASVAWDHATAEHPGPELAEAARRFGLDPDDPRSLLLSAVTRPADRATDIVARIRRRRDVDTAGPETAWHLGYALNVSGDVVLSAEYLRRAVDGLRIRGDSGLLPHALLGLAWVCYLGGAFAEGRACIDECLAIAIDLGDPGLAAAARVSRAWYEAVEGRMPDADAIARASRLTPHTLDARVHRATLTVAAGMAALASGRPRDALPSLLRLTDPADPAYQTMFRIVSLPDLVEAALLAGDEDLARTQAAAVARLTGGWDTAAIQGSLGLARAMLADGSALDAVGERLDDRPLPVALFDARAHLHLGARLRRARRIGAARRHLHIALDAFVSFPAPTWAQRCREELRAGGERLPDAQPSGRHVLTRQELRIGTLAASGLGNREIAEQLFLSPRTVGAHLYAAFRKLGIHSRDELAGVLSAAPVPAPPADPGPVRSRRRSPR